MRLLYVTDLCPWPATSGGQLRHARLIEQLASRNETRVVVLDSPPPLGTEVPANTEFVPIRHLTEVPRIPTNGWGQRMAVARSFVHPLPERFQQFCVPAVTNTLRSLRKLASDYDVCWVAWPYFAAMAMDQWPRSRVVVDYVDIATFAQGSQIPQIPFNIHKILTIVDTCKLAWHERRVAQRAWRATVCKVEDGKFLGLPQKVFVVPNGTDPRPLLPPSEADPMRLLFVGLMSYLPNLDAVRWFIGDCLPLLADLPVKMDVVGRDPPPIIRELEDGDRVRVHGFAPDLTELYRRAAIVVAPIRLGSGTKLKVLEALGFGKALVATTEAVRGLKVRPGIDFLQADTPAEMAEACRRLIHDAGLREQLGRMGRERIEQLYTWDRIGEQAQRAVTP